MTSNAKIAARFVVGCSLLLASPSIGLGAVPGQTEAQAVPPVADAPSATEQMFGRWASRCQQQTLDGKSGSLVCGLVQDVVIQNDGKSETVMSISFAQAAGAQGHSMTLRVPLGVRLKQGLSLAIDQGAPRALDFDFCGPRGCWATGPADGALLSSLKTGATGQVRVMRINGQPLVVEFPLAGFGAALAALDSSNGAVMVGKGTVQ
jgi:invasion protein IalB